MKSTTEQSANTNYDGLPRRSINATVRPPELAAGIAAQKKAFAEAIAKNDEYRRVPKGAQSLRHKLPIQEDYADDGEVKVTRPITATQRINH